MKTTVRCRVAKRVFVPCLVLLVAVSSCSTPSDEIDDLSDDSASSGDRELPDDGDSVDDGDSDETPTGDTSDPGDTSEVVDTSEASDSSVPSESLAAELGLAKYAGQIHPIVHKETGNITTYRFDPAEGPLCMRGGTFFTSVRDAGAEDLVVFLQEGGVCSSEFCFAGNKAMDSIPDVDILNPNMEVNPVAAWNHVFVPYCDGSFFAGDAEHSDNLNNRGKRYHHGLANMTAALEVAKARFPSPGRILLAGSSGGSYGLLFAGILMRHYYPDAELILMFDSGIGLGKDGDTEYLETILDEFNLHQFLPGDCSDCKGRGHLTGLVGYILKRDPQMRAGMFSSWNDTILTKLYLRIPGSVFAAALEEQTAPIHEAYPNRFRRFIMNGVQHCALLGNPSTMGPGNWNSLEMPPGAMGTLVSGNIKIGKLKATRIGELTMSDWLTALIENDTDVWIDIQE